MIPASLIGNPFHIRRNIFINKKGIFYYVLSVLFASLFSFVFLKEPIAIRSLILSSLIAVLVASFIILIQKIKIFLQTIKDYFIVNWITISHTLIQVLLAISIYFVLAEFKTDIYLIMGSIYFWIFSGFLRVINERTPFLYKGSTRDLLDMFRLYSINRLSFFFIFLIGMISSETFTQEINLFFSNAILLLFFAFSLVYFYFITTNLIPYLIRSSYIRNCIIIIKLIATHPLSYEKIKDNLEELLIQKDLDYLLENLVYSKYVVKENRRYVLNRRLTESFEKNSQ